MENWFTLDQIDTYTHIISEYRHWEETHCYLLEGSERCLLIDTGLGICNISEVVKKLTDKPVTAGPHMSIGTISADTNTTRISMHMRRN